MNPCLLLIDLQNDYFPGGAMELVGIDAAADRAAFLLAEFRKRGWPRVHVQHLAARAGATFFLPGTPGAQPHQSVLPGEGEGTIVKHFPNSFRDTPLLDLLRQKTISQLVIAGAMSHMCIDATTRAAFDLGFNCLVAEDACATRDLQFKGGTIPAAMVHGAFMAALSSPYAQVMSASACIESLS